MDRVVKGFVIPVTGHDGIPRYYRVFDAAAGREMLNHMVDLTRRVLEDYSGGAMIKSARELNSFLDSLVFYIKGLFYLDPVPGFVAGVSPPPQAGLYYYSKSRIVRGFKPPYTREGLRDYCYHSMVEKLIMGDEKSLELFSESMRARLYECMQYPADTRPGSNTSSLLLHLLLTSAVACCRLIDSMYDATQDFRKFMADKDVQRRIAVLRLISLFHDIGKFDMERWHEHHVVSSQVLRKIFDGYVGDEAKEIVETAAGLVSGERVEEYMDLYRLQREADASASNIDRVQKLFWEALSKSLKAILEEKIESYCSRKGIGGRDAALMKWDFWEEVGFEDVVRMTEDYCKNISVIGPENPALTYEGEVIARGVRIVRFDVAGIQRFIRSDKLPALVGGSRIVDVLVYVALPYMLVERFNLPAETILCYGGGNLTVLLPSKAYSQISEEVRTVTRRELGLELNYGSSPLYNSMYKVNREIDGELTVMKMIGWEGGVSLNLYRRCSWCKTRYASERDGDDYICDTCKWKKEVGEIYHFQAKCRQLGLDWEKIKGGVPEYIAGLEAGEQATAEKYPSIAFVRFDGNLMSQLISSSTSITDLVERSIRIDRSIKEAFRDFYVKLRKLSVEDSKRIVLGLLYIGGDDGALILPSYLALQFALHMVNQYYFEMGCKSTLSVGIAVAKPKHPVVPLYESAGYLLDEVAKGGCRLEALREVHAGRVEKPSLAFRGSIAFYTADGGLMNPESLGHVLSVEYRSRMSSQLRIPYTVSDAGYRSSIVRLLKPVKPGLTLESLENPLETIGIVDEENLKDIRNSLLDIMHKTLMGDSSVRIKILHAGRQIGRQKAGGVIKEFVKNLLHYDSRTGELRFNLADEYQLIKILGRERS